MAKQVSVIYMVKDPPLERLVAQVEYMRSVADQFVFVVDDRTDNETVDTMLTWDGAVIVPFKWVDNFAAGRNAALPHVTRPWTLHLDPDELPSYEMMKHIKMVTDPGRDATELAWIYWTPNWRGGKKGDEKPYHWHIRLWRTGCGKFYRNVHELVELDGMWEGVSRGTTALHAPQEARLIHSKGLAEAVESQEYYETLGERSL